MFSADQVLTSRGPGGGNRSRGTGTLVGTTALDDMPIVGNDISARIPSAVFKVAPSGHEYGVPRTSLRDLLRGQCTLTRVQNAVYDHWVSKRQQDPEQLPLLGRLRQEAAQMRARRAQFSSAQSDVLSLRVHLQRVRRLLALSKRREKLKAQIAALSQSHFEAVLKQRRSFHAQSTSARQRPRQQGKQMTAQHHGECHAFAR